MQADKNILQTGLLKNLIHVISPYWKSKQRNKGILYLLGIIISVLIYTKLVVFMTASQGDYMTALERKDRDSFFAGIIYYFSILIIYVPFFVVALFLREVLALDWRNFLTKYLVEKYLSGNYYYKLESEDKVDNPDQRISEDVKSFTSKTVEIAGGGFDAILTILTLSFVLWEISGLSLVLALVLGALVTLIGTWIFGGRLSLLNFEQYRREADLRQNLMRTAEHSESIAFYRAEEQEKKNIFERLGLVVKNNYKLIFTRSGLFFFQHATRFGMIGIPFFLVGADYLNGKVEKFGTVQQAASLFVNILYASSFLADQIQNLAAYKADLDRIVGVMQNFSEEKTDSDSEKISYKNAEQLKLDKVNILNYNSPGLLLKDLNLQIQKGERILIVGRSGSGKTSLLRAIAGIRDRGKGEIDLPGRNEIFFLPQKPYMPRGNLLNQLNYSLKNKLIDKDKFAEALERVSLSDLAERFGWDEETNFSNSLSLGEQQKLGFARLILYSPSLVILDEATSAMDVTSENRVYNEIVNMNLTVLSVSHSENLKKFHNRILILNGDGSWNLEKVN